LAVLAGLAVEAIEARSEVEMESTVTVKLRTIVLAVAIMLAMLAAYFVGAVGTGGGAASAADDAAATSENKIVMSGTSDVTGIPDQLTFHVSVRNTSSDVSTALGNAGNAMHRVLAALNGAGIDRKDTQSTGFSLHPEYSYSNGTRVLVGYQASQGMTVLVRSLPDAGNAISAAVDAGGNSVQIGDVRLKIANMDALLSKARADAVADAKAKADDYVDAAGASLGDVVSVREVATGGGQKVVQLSRSAYDSASAALPIRPGRSTLKVTVSITWSLG
jgi:uncharacterized protein